MGFLIPGIDGIIKTPLDREARRRIGPVVKELRVKVHERKLANAMAESEIGPLVLLQHQGRLEWDAYVHAFTRALYYIRGFRDGERFGRPDKRNPK
jgi:hypothetical protein